MLKFTHDSAHAHACIVRVSSSQKWRTVTVQTPLFRNGADSHLAQIPNRSHDQQLGPREPGMLAETLRMKVRRPDNPPESYQYIFITVHSNTPIRSWEFLYTPNY